MKVGEEAGEAVAAEVEKLAQRRLLTAQQAAAALGLSPEDTARLLEKL